MGGASTIDVGEYVQDGTSHDLTDDHVTDTTDGFVVDAPDTADEIRVNPAYVESRVDPFDVDHAYEPDGDRLVIADDDATFTDFAASTETVFTRGASDSIRFADRPMWLSVDTSGTDTVAFEAHDATDDGQAIRVDASWLESHGVADPVIAYYHDGTTIPVEATADESAYVVDAPHFSHIRITTVDLDTSWKQEGHTRGFFADGPSDSGTFNITVSEVTSGEIEFRFWSVQNGSRNVFDGDETFEKVDRESLDQSGYYTFNFINETNLGTGYAMLGDDQYHLDKVNLNLDTYDFTNGDLTYRFDQTTGFLEEVVDDGNGAAISLQDVRTDTVPSDAASGHYKEAQLTQEDGPMVVHAEWARGAENPWVTGPYWTGVDENETVAGNILSGETDVKAIAHYQINTTIENSEDIKCSDYNCEADGHTKKFHVHWDPGSNTEWDRRRCTSPCSKIVSGTHTLTGDVDHGDLLEKGSVPFWLCGHAIVEGDNTEHKDHLHWHGGEELDLCPDSKESFHPGHEGKPAMGYIFVDPTIPLG